MDLGAALVRRNALIGHQVPEQTAAVVLPRDGVILLLWVERRGDVGQHRHGERAAREFRRPRSARRRSSPVLVVAARGGDDTEDRQHGDHSEYSFQSYPPSHGSRLHDHGSNTSRLGRPPFAPGSPCRYAQTAFRGSSASRRPSPTRLNANVVRNRASPGKIISQGAHRNAVPASASIAPHEGVPSGNPHAEERESGLEQDVARDDERGVDDDRRGHVREDLPEDDAPVRGSQRARGFHELLLADRQHLAANDAGDVGPPEQPDDQDHGPQPRV